MDVQEAPLLKLQCPCLFITAEGDQLCPSAALAEAQQRMQSTSVQSVLIQVRNTYHTALACRYSIAGLIHTCDALKFPLR